MRKRRSIPIIGCPGYLPKDSSPEPWRIPEICKTCHYRKLMGITEQYTKNDWSNTACHYHLDTGTLRETRPTDTHCDYYIPKTEPESCEDSFSE